MDLLKKTTILFTTKQHLHLVRVAKRRGLSLGELIRSACQAQYGAVSEEDRLVAVGELRELNLPVGTPAEMKLQSVPDAGKFPS